MNGGVSWVVRLRTVTRRTCVSCDSRTIDTPRSGSILEFDLPVDTRLSYVPHRIISSHEIFVFQDFGIFSETAAGTINPSGARGISFCTGNGHKNSVVLALVLTSYCSYPGSSAALPTPVNSHRALLLHSSWTLSPHSRCCSAVFDVSRDSLNCALSEKFEPHAYTVNTKPLWPWRAGSREFHANTKE